MLEEIRRGSGEAWSQVVERYQGRLLAYAVSHPAGSMRRMSSRIPFCGSFGGFPGFRQEASLETFLFVILRRTLADAHRGRRINVRDLGEQDSLPGAELTASRYARRDEQRPQEILADALRSLVSRMQEKLNFADLQTVEMLFSVRRAAEPGDRQRARDRSRASPSPSTAGSSSFTSPFPIARKKFRGRRARRWNRS